MGLEEAELSNDEVLYWQNRLQERKANFLEARNFLKKHVLTDLSLEEAGEISKFPFHLADVAKPVQEEITLDTLLEKNLKMSLEAEEALDRLERGVFGICKSCGQTIARSRLEAIPETRYCLDCQTDVEEMRRASAVSKTEKTTLKSFDSILVSDVMRENLVVAHMGQNLDVATQLMSDNNIRHLPIVDEDGDIQGIISDRDLLGIVLDGSWRNVEEFEAFWSKKSVASLMTKNPETVSPDTTLKDAGAILLDNKISCLPVVEGNRLVGIITDTDFVRIVSE